MSADERTHVIASRVVHPEADVPLVVGALLDHGRESRTTRSRTNHNAPSARRERNGHGAESQTSTDGGERITCFIRFDSFVGLLVGETLRPFGDGGAFEIVAHRDPVDVQTLRYFVGRHAVLVELDYLSGDSWREFSRRLPYFPLRQTNAGL